MKKITINEKKFEVEERGYKKVIEVEYVFLEKLNLSQIPKNICITTQKDEFEATFMVQKINDNTVEIELSECFRGKYWDLKLGVAPYMEIKKKVLEQIAKEGYAIEILTFEMDDEDDYNHLVFTIKIKGDNMSKVLKYLEETLSMLDSKVNAVIEDINSHIEDVIKTL